MINHSMSLSPYGKILLGSVLIAFGITVLGDFSLLAASLYVSAVFLSLLFFLEE